MRNSLPAVSVVIEWENAKLAELDRARRMLAALAAQLRELRPEMEAPPELIVLYDREAIPADLIARCVGEAFGDPPEVAVRVLPTEHAGYYAQKNRGAQVASGELVLFLDSDVVPERGWLAALLSNFRDPEVAVACGNTYVEPAGFYAKAFALFWFFPLRDSAPPAAPVEAEHFFANNVCFRRELFLRYGFPDLPLMRGACVELAKRLRADGHRILIDGRARVSHPPPNGAAHFVRRALCEGHDSIQQARLRGARRRGFGLATAKRFVTSVRRARARILANRRAVGLGAGGAAAAFGLALGYYALCAVGELVGTVSPETVRRRLAV